MLTLKELKELKDLVKSKTLKTPKDFIAILETEYTDKNPMQDAFTRSRDVNKHISINDCVSPTRIKDTSLAKSSDFERKNMVKVRTGKASEEADAVKGAPKVGE